MSDSNGAPLKDIRDGAMCRDDSVDPEIFFGIPGNPVGDEAITAAKEVCNGGGEADPCPVREACLEYSLQANEPFGVWGGLDENERRKLRRDRRAEERHRRVLAAAIIRTPTRRVVRRDRQGYP